MKQIIKVLIDKDNNVISTKPVEYKEMYIMGDVLNDAIVVDEETGTPMRMQDSSQGKKRVKELMSKKKLNEYEKSELIRLVGEEEAKKFLESL